MNWIAYVGSGLLASFVVYGLYINATQLGEDGSTGNIFAVLGSLGLLLILAATVLQRRRS